MAVLDCRKDSMGIVLRGFRGICIYLEAPQDSTIMDSLSSIACLAKSGKKSLWFRMAVCLSHATDTPQRVVVANY